MNPGNMEIAHSTADQTHGMMTRLDVTRKLGSQGPQGLWPQQAHKFHGLQSPAFVGNYTALEDEQCKASFCLFQASGLGASQLETFKELIRS